MRNLIYTIFTFLCSGGMCAAQNTQNSFTFLNFASEKSKGISLYQNNEDFLADVYATFDAHTTVTTEHAFRDFSLPLEKKPMLLNAIYGHFSEQERFSVGIEEDQFSSVLSTPKLTCEQAKGLLQVDIIEAKPHSSFWIEKSHDGSSFEPICKENTLCPSALYAELSPQKNTYRIVQKNQNGKLLTSQIISSKACRVSKSSSFIEKTAEESNILIFSPTDTHFDIDLLDASYRLIGKKRVRINPDKNSFAVNDLFSKKDVNALFYIRVSGNAYSKVHLW